MTNVLAFRARPAAEPVPAPPALPTAEEMATAMVLVDHAMVALGSLDFDALAGRLLAALKAQADAEPDNCADAAIHRLAAEANALVAAAAFRRIAETVAGLRTGAASC